MLRLPPLLTLLLIVALTGPTHASSLEQRQTFLAAERALAAGQDQAYRALAARLADYPLLPYLHHQDLKARLETLPVAAVRRFLDTYADSPLAPRLRRDWLETLTEAGRWDEFLADYRDLDSTVLDCLRRQALLARGQSREALADIESLWLVGRSQPSECDPLFNRWQDQGGFTRQRVWTRFTLAMDNRQAGLGRYLSRLMPAADRVLAEQWLAVDADPRRVLEADRFDPEDARTRLIILHGLDRWAHQDSVAAARALEALKPRYELPREKLLPLERKLALFVASRGDPSAEGRLAALSAEAVDESVWEWRVRIGLQRQDWDHTLDWIERMPPAVAREGQWRYWRARALEALGRNQEAEPLYRQLAGERSYYGFLAADRVGAPYRLNPDPVEPDAGLLAALETHPGLQRARELFLLGRAWQGRVEWNHVLDSLDEAGLKQAAILAHRWGWHDRTIATLGRARHWGDLELRFPLPHRQRVLEAARAENIDPAWVYAVMRQESIFQPDARSHAGALGLMQIMPATGQQIARRLKASDGGRSALLDESTSIRYGAHYLRLVLDQLQDSPMLATAAYNAGPGRVKSWLPPGTMAPDIWAELIPFHETRKYVKRVMEYATVYQQLLGRDAHGSLKGRMPAVLATAR